MGQAVDVLKTQREVNNNTMMLVTLMPLELKQREEQLVRNICNKHRDNVFSKVTHSSGDYD